jgi:hypothetical protein
MRAQNNTVMRTLKLLSDHALNRVVNYESGTDPRHEGVAPGD